MENQNDIVELSIDEINEVAGGPLPLAAVAAGIGAAAAVVAVVDGAYKLGRYVGNKLTEGK